MQKKNTRTSLQVVQPSDEESEEPGVVCTLKNGAENHTLDLLVSDDIQLSVAGENPSNIYLVGFLSPADQYIGDNPLDLENDMDEIEDDEALEEELKNLRSNQAKPARKRNLAEMEAEDNTKKPPASAKKQKTATGAAKPAVPEKKEAAKPAVPEKKEATKPTVPEKKETTKAAPAEQENNQKKQNPNQNQQKNSNPKPNPPNVNPNQAQNANANANANANPNPNPNPNANPNANPKKKKNKKKKNQKENSEQGPATATKDEVMKEASAEKAKETPAEKAKETPVEKAKETPVEKAKETPAEKAKEAPAEKAKETKEAGETKTETKTETKDNKGSGSETWKNGPQGLKFNDIRAGTGKAIKKGSKVKVHYVGQLPDKHVFDKVIEGEGFAFEIGAGEVIQGWEKGLLGMKVGGKRRLQIPAKLAYGADGSKPEIPPNTDLTFTIEIKSVD